MMPIEKQLWIVEFEDGSIEQIEIEYCDGTYEGDGWTIKADSIYEAFDEYKSEEKHLKSITAYQKVATAFWDDYKKMY